MPPYEQILPQNHCELDDFAIVDDDTDDTGSCSVDSFSLTHKLSASMSSVTTTDGEGIEGILSPAQDSVGADDLRLHRIPTLAATVKINVEGAFIVDEDSEGAKENGTITEHAHWERKDIRLPYHTDVVSHVAVDVSHCLRCAQLGHHG
jgi:hypothetical protein